jgi:PAS domain S-box-containing protein
MMEKDQNNGAKNDVNKPCSILVVEDDEGLSRLIMKSLKNTGFDVEVVYNGAQAVDWVVNNPVDLMMLDYKLPDMSAKQIVDALKEQKIKIPFIIMTGHGDEKIAVEMMKTGAKDYIVKEGGFFELLPSVVKWVFEELESEKKLAQANKALKESEEKYRFFVDNALVGVYKANLKGDILYANKALSKLFEHESSEEMMLDNVLQTPENEKNWNVLIDKLKKKGDVENFEVEIVTRTGKTKNLILSGSLVGGILTGMIMDVTEKREFEKRLLQSEKLKAMGVMAAGIAHDFNNVLAIINGYAQLLQSSCDDNEELLNGLRTICRAVKDGTETVRRMSEFNRMEKDKSEFVSVNMVEMVKQAVDFSKPKWKDLAHARGATYNLDLEGLNSVPNVLGRPSELREVITNMINNAIDAMPGSGRIAFRTWNENNTVCTSISDNGCGMSKDIQMRIFDPFYSTKGVEGSGLGMSVVYGIIGKHGGKIDIESQIENGTIFIIRLPVATETIHAEASLEPVNNINVKAKNYRILVVDDVKEISDILNMFLDRQGYNVDSVESGAEAIKLLKKESYDLLLCDLGMPEVSGWDMVRAVESLDRKPKIGLITGWVDMLESLKNEDMGVDFVVSKPINFSILSGHIIETLMIE